MSGDVSQLAAGTSALIGSLPHPNIESAITAQLDAGMTLLTLPELIAAGPHEGLLARGLGILPEVAVNADGTISVDRLLVHHDVPEGIACLSETELEFLRHPSVVAAPAIKVQTLGPLTAARALVAVGLEPNVARYRGILASRARVQALSKAARSANPNATVLVMLDEPSLATTAYDPSTSEDAADVLSGVLMAAGRDVLTGIHPCGNNGIDTAFAAGCDVLCVVPTPDVFNHMGTIVRHTEAGGYLAWGAIPTSGPIHSHAEGAWETLVRAWCELSNRGCEPLLLRVQALITPECGLGNHSVDAAERVLGFVSELEARVRDQIVATRLSLGA